MTTYYAVSSIGYGRAETPEEAFENYVAAQKRSFNHLTVAQLLDIAPGQVLKAPEGAEGFILDGRLFWTDADEKVIREAVYNEEIVAWIGKLPIWAEVGGETAWALELPVMQK